MPINLIVAFCKNFGIGYQNRIPWHIQDDLKHFRELTKGNIIIMGYQTYMSLKKPLPDRFNIVIYEKPETSSYSNLLFLNMESVKQYLSCYPEDEVYVIGGESIYRQFLIDYEIGHIYATYIDKEYACDRHFNIPEQYKLVQYSENMYNDEEECNYRFLEYEPLNEKHSEYEYLNLLEDIMSNGNSRSDRTGTGTVGVFGRQLHFNIRDTIPILTTKFVPFKMIVKELLWFLQGQTDNKLLQKQGVHIWDGNTTREFLDKRGLNDYEEGQLGPMYGFLWRHCGAEYKDCHSDYTNQGVDQLEQVIKLLKTDPYSRRIAMTTYNVGDLEKGVLYPCHGIYTQFYVNNKNNKNYLSCHMLQRSVDCGCGLPFNIVSYAILTYIIAQKVDMIPDELIISTGDTHIYNNHKEDLRLQMKRKPYVQPKLRIKDIRDKKWEEIKLEDFELVGYFSHPSIKLSMNV